MPSFSGAYYLAYEMSHLLWHSKPVEASSSEYVLDPILTVFRRAAKMNKYIF